MMPATPMPAFTPAPAAPTPSPGSGVALSAEQVTKAQKYCKWASSALNYDDIPTAILNLQKGLNLLQTGQDC
jgi:vacuolar protein sorting-associated protein VTA1